VGPVVRAGLWVSPPVGLSVPEPWCPLWSLVLQAWGSQAYLGPRADRGWSRPGDMMIDWLSPACGGSGRSVFGGRPRVLPRQEVAG
jgi:hypothetical protein